jgi:hypothetical protein
MLQSPHKYVKRQSGASTYEWYDSKKAFNKTSTKSSSTMGMLVAISYDFNVLDSQRYPSNMVSSIWSLKLVDNSSNAFFL